MKRLTWFDDSNVEKREMNCNNCPTAGNCNDSVDCKNTAVNRLAQIEDILGDDYDLDRLRKLVEENKKSLARKCPKCGEMKLYPRVDWKYFYCYSCKETFPEEKIIHPKAAEAALAKEE